MPKLVYSNYSDVRKIPTDLMSAIPVCDEVRKAKMIAAVQKLLEVDVIRQGDKAILNWISSDYIFNIVPYVFNPHWLTRTTSRLCRTCSYSPASCGYVRAIMWAIRTS